MKLACPGCDAGFTIDDSLIGATGRRVKCSRCGHRWRAFPPSDRPGEILLPDRDETQISQPLVTGAPSETAPPETPVARETPVGPEVPVAPHPPPTVLPEEGGRSVEPGGTRPGADSTGGADRPGTRSRGRRGWLLAVILVALALPAGAYLWRNEIAIQFPTAGQAYSRLGIPMDPVDFGLSVSTESAQFAAGADGRLLTVKGAIANASEFVLDAPSLNVTVFDADNRIVIAWTETLPQRRVQPQSSLSYSVQRSGIPERGAIVAVTIHVPDRLADLSALAAGAWDATVFGASLLMEKLGNLVE